MITINEADCDVTLEFDGTFGVQTILFARLIYKMKQHIKYNEYIPRILFSNLLYDVGIGKMFI